MVLGLKSLSTITLFSVLKYFLIRCHNHRIWVKLYGFREEAPVPPAAVSLISSPAWATTCPAATPAIRATAVSLKPSVTAVAWTTLAKTNKHIEPNSTLKWLMVV